MSLLAICQWLQDTAGGSAIRQSIYLYPILDAIHVLSLGLFLGSIAIVDLRLLGAGLRSEPVSEVAGRLLPWTWAGFALMAVSGGLVFWSEPVKCYQSHAFRLKMLLMALAGLNALVFHLTAYRSVGEWGGVENGKASTPIRAKLAGALSLVLWTGVLFSGRFVGYKF